MPPTPETVDVSYIAPRHLAGGGDPAWITVPLHRACGWSYGHDPLMPRVILSSPDQRALLRLEPDPDSQWWTLHHAPERDRPAWYASFGARTPVEIIAGFTDALTDPAATAAAADPYEPLERAGWTPTSLPNGLVSPDGKALVERLESEGTGHWFVTTTLTSRPVWQARFGEHTPAHLIAAFTAALADPSPLPRTGSPLSIPTRNPNHVTRTHREVPAVQVASALEERVHALAARRADPPASPSALRRPPTKNGRIR
ncbi:DUF317 domain-containing protein [Streptomyces scopuliridis]|uniref:DUF317 domain-containing protein n=1 Tax=Streptomyces scopuliridis TaxID=452529 RepID=A0ACD4ZTC6_9ACTN|nr:DUF317 domain-containing protein [Streptomyces scopuliridis]WSC01546.1 DUF317 domain-containing protein [Streptomyces scopuliridis]WSC04916.1 DUF317 domain-containing protein [Streptomyces scopuliridis]